MPKICQLNRVSHLAYGRCLLKDGHTGLCQDASDKADGAKGPWFEGEPPTDSALKDVRDWLADHRDHIDPVLRDTGYDHQLRQLAKLIAQVEHKDALLHSAWEFLTSQWEPDDGDRATFVKDLAEELGEDDE